MTTLCTVTGILHDRQGNPVTNADISLAYPSGVEGGDGLYSPVVIQTTTSGAGAIDVDLYNGRYLGTLVANGSVETFYLDVPEAATADVGDCVSANGTLPYGAYVLLRAALLAADPKVAPVDADALPLIDSEDGEAIKRVSVADLGDYLGIDNLANAAQLYKSAIHAALDAVRDEAAAAGANLADDYDDILFVDATSDFESLAVVVKDTGDAANDFVGSITDFIPADTFGAPKLCLQQDGSLKYQPHNDILWSEDLTASGWTAAGCTVAADDEGPAAGYESNLITATGTGPYVKRNLTFAQDFHRTDSIVVKAGTASWCYLQVQDGATVYRAWFNLSTGEVGTTEAGLTASISPLQNDGAPYYAGWYRISVSRKAAASSGSIWIRPCDADGGTTVTVGRTMKAALAHGHTGLLPVDYLKTTTAKVYGAPYDWTPGHRAVRFDFQTSYRGRYSDDLTNAAWVKSGCTVALDATGPHGEPCSTVTVTVDNGTVQQAVTSSGTAQMGFGWIRRKTGSGTVELSMDGGSTFTDVTAMVGLAGGPFGLAYLRGAAADPTIVWRFGTAGDVFEMALVNVSATYHVPPPAPSVAADLLVSVEDLKIPVGTFPSAAAQTAYFDIWYPKTALGSPTGGGSLGFYGAGSDRATVDISQDTGDDGFLLKSNTNDGTSRIIEMGDFEPAGRLQVQYRVAENDHSICANGSVPWLNHLPGAITFTHFGLYPFQSIWLNRLAVIPSGVSDDADALRTWMLDADGENVDTNILGAAFLYRAGSNPVADLARIPAIEVLYERGDKCGIIAVTGEKFTAGYGTESPKRAIGRRYEFDRAAGTLTPLGDSFVIYEPSGWSSGLGGVQGFTLIKIKHGPYRGRLVLVLMEQDSVSGTRTDDARNLYVMISDENGADGSWSAPVKILDISAFGLSNGFVATGENGTSFQLTEGAQEGRVYMTLNANNQNNYAFWCDDFKTGGDGSGETWAYSTTPVPYIQPSGGHVTEPALAVLPDDKTMVMLFRNASSGTVKFSVSGDYGNTFDTVATAISGYTDSADVNNGFVQDDIAGDLGVWGRLVAAKATYGTRQGHVIMSANDAAMTFGDVYRLMARPRFAGYTVLKKAFAGDDIFVAAIETQPEVSTNVDTSVQVAVFRYPVN